MGMDPRPLIELRADPASLRESYVQATPFPHIVIDGLFDDSLLDQVLDDFPRPADTEWRRFDGPNERKLGFHHAMSHIAPRLRTVLDALNGFEVLLFLEALTGIEGLVPDPYFGGGGLHQIENGGFLKIHTDFNVHPKMRLDRRLNMLVYLNRDWRDEYGGHLELWDASCTNCEKRIAPLFNRTVIFSTGETSFHGHPQPLTTPDGITRKSVSLYYYTNGRPAHEQAPEHDTVFVEAGLRT